MNKPAEKDLRELAARRKAPLGTRTDLSAAATKDIAAAMNAILADAFALYLKTKNFHWHISGPHFRDYHLLLDEQADQIFAMTDPIAERIRKIGGSTLRSIGHIARAQRVRSHIESGEKSGVRGTPGFFVDGVIQDVSFGMQRLFAAVTARLPK